MRKRNNRGRLARWLIPAGMALAVGTPAPADATVTDLIERLRGQLQRSIPEPPRPPAALDQGPSRQLQLNGLPLRVLTGTAPGSVESVLAFYTQEFMQKAPKGVPDPLTLRHQGADSGYLLQVQPASAAAMQRLVRGELALTATGPLRIIYAQRGSRYTQYLVAWSRGPIPPEVLTPPPEHDAPGEDLPNVPRPGPSSVRTFSMSEPASGYATVSYKVPELPALALARATAILSGAGFLEDRDFAAAQQTLTRNGADQGVLMAHLARRERTLLVSVRPDPNHIGSTVTYVSRSR